MPNFAPSWRTCRRTGPACHYGVYLAGTYRVSAGSRYAGACTPWRRYKHCNPCWTADEHTPLETKLNLACRKRETLQEMKVRPAQCILRMLRIAQCRKFRMVIMRQVGTQPLSPGVAEDSFP